jgi:hypothetical protein
MATALAIALFGIEGRLVKVFQFLGGDGQHWCLCTAKGSIKTRRTFRWVVEFEVMEAVVAYGFSLDDEKAHSMLARASTFSFGNELSACVLEAPEQDAIKRAQGSS